VATWVYEMTDPMASYLVQVAIGDFDIVESTGPDGLPIRHAIDTDVSRDQVRALDRTGEMIDVLDDMFGPFPFDTYGGLVVDEEIGFALEDQTLTLFSPGAAGDESTVVHELAHQWFGDDVSPALWKDVWLNEGFATYASWLWSERTGGEDADSLARQVDQADGAALDLPPADPGPDDLFAGSVYDRGALTLHVLRRTIGDDAFFTLLHRWVERYGGRSASTADFEALAEEVSGQELTPMFDAWLRAPTAPSLADWLPAG
jgi:aminopeptidase N